MKNIKLYAIHPAITDLNSFFTFFHLKNIREEYNFIWSPCDPDYLIVTEVIYASKKYASLFKQLYSNSKIKIFYGGEAVHCDWNLFDYGVGFDYGLEYSDRFVQILPPFKMFGNFIFDHYNSIQVKDEALLELRKKQGFCNFLYSNYCANPMRDNLFYGISKYKSVDSLGKHLNNVSVKGTGYHGHISDCVLLKKPYKFSIASENAYFPGYTSEKIITSLQAHTVPIYWGDPEITKNINEKCFINCHNYNSMDEIIDAIKKVDNDDELWCSMVSEPWQTEENKTYEKMRMDKYLDFFRNIFDQDIKHAARCSEGTFIYKYRDFFWGNKYAKYQRILRNKIQKILKI